MGELNVSEVPTDDTFRILIATDNHLGYGENDGIRGEDSFNTFEEILQLAKDHAVDFVLLGGDLFHENKPSTECLHKCLDLLRKYCMGDKPNKVEFISDAAVNFRHCSNPVVNYYDPNLNISIPVYSIHGNHDDPSGQKHLSSLDILSSSGLINYFGKWTDLRKVIISPILLRKGSSKLALYGLSHIKDERLFRLFKEKEVKFYCPEEHNKEWFNIFVCHQNREERGTVKHLPENFLPDFLDLVLWGHEHECRIKEEWNNSQEVCITQPGSSVATSLCEGEAKKKFVGLLHIWNKKFKLQPIPLKTVRPFVFEKIVLSQCRLPEQGDNMAAKVQDYLEQRIEFLIEDAKKQLTGHRKQPVLPLVRVRVEYSDEVQAFNVIRFSQRFESTVANTTDMILLKREKKIGTRKTKDDDDENRDNFEEFLSYEVEEDWEKKMDVYMKKYFDDICKKNLGVLTLKGMSEAVARFLDKSDKESVKAIVTHQMQKVEKHLCKKKVDVEKIEEEIQNFRVERNPAEEVEEIKKIMNNRIIPPKSEERCEIIDDDDENAELTNSDQEVEEIVPNTKGRGRGRGRGRGGRARATTSSNTSTRAATTRASGTGRGTRGRSSRAVASTTSSRASAYSSRNLVQSKLKFEDSDSD